MSIGLTPIMLAIAGAIVLVIVIAVVITTQK